MKKIIFLIIFLIPIVALSQTLVDSDRVVNKHGATADTLNKDDVLSDTYYVKSFSKDAELFWTIDSVAGKPKVKLGFYGSYDYATWITIDETTLLINVGDTTFLQSSGTYLFPYLKATATAVDSTQTIRFKYNLVIYKN